VGKKLEQRRRELVRELVDLSYFLRGSVCEVYRVCGRPDCKCARGEKHGPLYQLTWHDGTSTKTAYIPKRRVQEARELVARYDRLKEVIAELAEVNVKIWRRDARVRRTRKADDLA
jgi:hypothetical protein